MKIFVLVISVSLARLSQVSAQAPGDESHFCRTDSYFAPDHIFPPEVKILMDSHDYIFLDFIWERLDEDGDNINWSTGLSVCEGYWERQCSGFTAHHLTGQKNWVFTQHVRYEAAKEVLLNATFSFANCRFEDCVTDYVTLYMCQSDSINNAARMNSSNYQPLLGDVESSRLQQQAFTKYQPQILRYARPENSNGFYLGLKDEGTCGQVTRLIAYYLVCPQKVDGLVTYPEVALPPQDSPDLIFDAECAGNAENATSLQVRASSSGCTPLAQRGPACRCTAGFELSEDGTSCQRQGAVGDQTTQVMVLILLPYAFIFVLILLHLQN